MLKGYAVLDVNVGVRPSESCAACVRPLKAGGGFFVGVIAYLEGIARRNGVEGHFGAAHCYVDAVAGSELVSRAAEGSFIARFVQSYGNGASVIGYGNRARAPYNGLRARRHGLKTGNG